MEQHAADRFGERKGRLLRGHQFAEKLFLQNVWWPVFGSFEQLHPEFEVYDWNRKSMFLDFAFVTSICRFGIEVDGYQSHVKEMDREKFSYALNRDTFLTGLGWKMLHFSFDDIQSRPEICRTLLQLAISPYLLRSDSIQSTTRIEKDILRLAWKLGRSLRPKDVRDEFGFDYRTIRKHLASLMEKQFLEPASRGRVIRKFTLKQGALEHIVG
ncbi:endonuclease domain-containing protein [Paenibacillus taihuensis]|nr:endonuclease domain-containing protein [Paenibacillus taihuensis]